MRTHGFTLIELLVVIAIMGIFASVVISNVSSARVRAQEAKTIASLRSAQTSALFCVEDGNNLNTPSIANPICTGQGNWPAPVGDGWTYGDVPSKCTFEGDVSDGAFTYCAKSTTKYIKCNESYCIIDVI